MVEELKKAYRKISNTALAQFERKLKAFTLDPDGHRGFIEEAVFANVLRSREISHEFIPEADHPTPDIRATIASIDIYFEVKAIQEDSYMSFINEVLEQVGQLPSQYQMTVRPVFIIGHDRAPLVIKVVEEIRGKVVTKDFSPLRYEDDNAKVFVRFETVTASHYSSPVRGNWPESRLNSGKPFLERTFEKILRKNIGQFKNKKPTFLVWYMRDESLSDFETQRSFRNSLRELLRQPEFKDVAGIIAAAPGWFVFENDLYNDLNYLKSIGLYDILLALNN